MNKITLAAIAAYIFISFTAQAQKSPYGGGEVDFGGAFTHTTDYGAAANYTGEGAFLRANVSLLGMLTNIEHEHRLVIGDYLGSALFLGGREATNTNPLGSIPTALGSNFWIGGSIEWGVQGYYKVTDKLDIGVKYYFDDVFDNARDQGNGPGEDDNMVIKYQVRYSKIMAEYGYATSPYSAGDKKQNWHSLCLKYFPDPESSGKNFGIRWEGYTDPKLQYSSYNLNSNIYPVYSGYTSYHIEIFMGYMF